MAAAAAAAAAGVGAGAAIVAVGAWGRGAAVDEPLTVAPPHLAFTLFCCLHAAAHAGADAWQADGGGRRHAFVADAVDAASWALQWGGPTLLHAAWLARVAPAAAAAHGDALAARPAWLEVDVRTGALRVTRAALPWRLAPLFLAPPTVRVARAFRVLTVRLTAELTLRVPLPPPPCAAVVRVADGAAAASAALGEPLAHFDGGAALLLRPSAAVRVLCLRRRAAPSTGSLVVSVACADGSRLLLLTQALLPGGYLPQGWADGGMAAALAAAAADDVSADFCAVLVPFCSVLHTATAVPPLVGLAHDLWARPRGVPLDAPWDADAAVVERATLHAAWHWQCAAASDAAAALLHGTVLAPVAGGSTLLCAVWLAPDGVPLATLIAPTHTLARRARDDPLAAACAGVAIPVGNVVPWGRQ